MNAVSTHILNLFETQGSNYNNTTISQPEHAVQTAYLAEQDGADPNLVVACLLHEIGDLLYADFVPTNHINQSYEKLGANWLSRFFPLEVCEPVRLQVSARRYLCAVNDDYYEQLPTDLKRDLDLHGGPMGSDEQEVFQQNPWHNEAMLLNQYDQQASQPSRVDRSLHDYVGLIEETAANQWY